VVIFHSMWKFKIAWDKKVCSEVTILLHARIIIRNVLKLICSYSPAKDAKETTFSWTVSNREIEDNILHIKRNFFHWFLFPKPVSCGKALSFLRKWQDSNTLDLKLTYLLFVKSIWICFGSCYACQSHTRQKVEQEK